MLCSGVLVLTFIWLRIMQIELVVVTPLGNSGDGRAYV